MGHKELGNLLIKDYPRTYNNFTKILKDQLRLLTCRMVYESLHIGSVFLSLLLIKVPIAQGISGSQSLQT
jgi:hypothetical protein